MPGRLNTDPTDPNMIPEPFETETMAELHDRQGRSAEAVAILRRLLDAHPQHPRQPVWMEKILELESRLQGNGSLGPVTSDEVPIPPSPGVIAVSGRNAAGAPEAIITWALPPTPVPPTIEVLLVMRDADGVETEKRRIAVNASKGRLSIPAHALHGVSAAAGFMDEDARFVAIARSPIT